MLQRREESTVWQILLMLKRNGQMSIDEISSALNITPIAVRQHILNLERNGFVSYHTRKKSVGRPGFIYSLTKKADDLFPHSYKNFVIDLLKDIESEDGRKRIDQLFKKRKERLLKEKNAIISGAKNFKTKVSLFVDSLKTDGYVVDIKEGPQEIELIQYNCPISIVSETYKEACKYELELYRELFGPSVRRLKCASDGDNYCAYLIPF